MALLASCWFIIEYIIIPDGFVKWFYLSFYINPIFLFLCWIFLWIKLLEKWLFFIFVLPFRITCSVGSFTLRVFRRCINFLFPFTKLSRTQVVPEPEEYEEVPQIKNQNQLVGSHELQTRGIEFNTCHSVGSVLHVDESTMEEQSGNINDHTSSSEYLFCGSSPNLPTDDVDSSPCLSSICSSDRSDTEMDGYVPSVCSSSSPFKEQEVIDESLGEELDSFYNKYTERMRWFDVLNHDRTYGISAVLNRQLASHGSFESIEPMDFSVPYITLSKMARKRLLRSLESDFEMVYVAQSCLSWEALHHQYRKVEVLASQNGVFYNNVAGRFQKFQVLLDRFMEDEWCEGKRYWTYVQRRSSLESLLQVPQVSGYMEEEKEGMEGEAMRATELLKAIEKCIKAFWLYVKTDEKKPWWKFKSLLWTCPPLEDPRDLKLLSHLSKTLQQKEIWLKDLQGKKRCWLKRAVNPTAIQGEYPKKEILFTMIDMKLVTRVLKMSIITTCQLKWCQEKLNNIEFRGGIVMRANTGPLFPSS